MNWIEFPSSEINRYCLKTCLNYIAASAFAIHPTNQFTIFEPFYYPENPLIEVFVHHKIRPLTDFESSKTVKCLAECRFDDWQFNLPDQTFPNLRAPISAHRRFETSQNMTNEGLWGSKIAKYSVGQLSPLTVHATEVKRLNLKEERPRQDLLLVLTLLFLSGDVLTPT